MVGLSMVQPCWLIHFQTAAEELQPRSSVQTLILIGGSPRRRLGAKGRKVQAFERQIWLWKPWDLITAPGILPWGEGGNSFLLDEKKIVNLTHLMSSVTISVVIINVQWLSAYWVAVKDREAWRAAGHGVSKSWTRLSNWTTGYMPFN